jgi:2-dehydro-3-deoxyphosphogluconate aldolase/(4S)-4-hydroxy-2-oxoglutarate aldolase
MSPAAGSNGDAAMIDRLGEIGVVPVATIDHSERAAELGAALLSGGIHCVEVSFRTEAAAHAIEKMSVTHPDLVVGAGTILSVAQAHRAVDAGARFLVSPAFDDEVVDWCRSNGVLGIPGVMSPTEINRAVRCGVELVKLFPAEIAGGTDALRSFAPVFPHVRYVPTGGIDERNLSHYLEIPSVVACGGSWLTPRDLIAGGEFDRIRQRVIDAASIVRGARGVR